MSLIKLASGGTATVYAGLDLATGELVALKRPHEHLASEPSFMRSLTAEVSIASRIVHPNVVRILDVDHADDVMRLVMPYVRGVALSELLVAAANATWISPDVALRIVADACAGLHAAHELRDTGGNVLGVVHRDVSPHNLMVGTDGITRVTDFGIAKSVDAHSEHSTTTGVLKGKFAYMAPEYIRGGPIDRRADIFALGVVLWEALAGERLFKGSNQIESSRMVLEKQVPSLATVAPELSRFDPLVAMALERRPEARVPSAREWLDAIERFPLASHAQVARVVEELVGEALAERQALIQKRLLVMAEVTSTGVQPPRDTLRMTTGFDPEDLAPTLVVQTVPETSGVQSARAAAEAVPETSAPMGPSLAPEPPPAPGQRPRRSVLIGVVAAVTLASASVLAIAKLRSGASTVAEHEADRSSSAAVVPASVEAPPRVAPAPSTETANVIDVTALPQPSASQQPTHVWHPTRTEPSSTRSVIAAPSTSPPPPSASIASPIIRTLPEDHRRPNPYAK